MSASLKKCRGEVCELRAACVRYYIAPNAAGWLDPPAMVAHGCLDFLASGEAPPVAQAPRLPVGPASAGQGEG